jgi:hypothetical protein
MGRNGIARRLAVGNKYELSVRCLKLKCLSSGTIRDWLLTKRWGLKI